MESYQIASSASRGERVNGVTTPASPLCGGVGAPLVNRCISRQDRKSENPVKVHQVYSADCRMVREYRGRADKRVPPTRTEIQSFSPHSRRRLKFTSSNANPALISQFGMTYHKATPDGRTIKRHLDNFLKDVRRKFIGVGYLWILEFQSRGVPHYHFFSTIPATRETGRQLAAIWHRIAEPESEEHLRFHSHKNNFIPWDMGTGSYLCKYLDKEAQKHVPEGFTGVGRFWGNSRDLAPILDEIESETITELYETEYVQKYIVRTLCRFQEKKRKGSKWRSAARRAPTSYLIQGGGKIIRQMMDYLAHNAAPSAPPPF